MPRLSVRTILFCVLLFFLPLTSTYADFTKLEQQIHVLVNEKYLTGSDVQPEVSIAFLSPRNVIEKICDHAEISFIGSTNRPKGNRTILARCGEKRSYIRINIHVTGSYWVAKETIQPGSKLNESVLILKRGNLSDLPADLLIDPKQLKNNVATRLIKAGLPVTLSQLRKLWVVHSGEEISISAQGNGFHIMATGKAMDNAGLNDQLRIRTRSGQIITGIATGIATARIKVDY